MRPTSPHWTSRLQGTLHPQTRVHSEHPIHSEESTSAFHGEARENPPPSPFEISRAFGFTRLYYVCFVSMILLSRTSSLGTVFTASGCGFSRNSSGCIMWARISSPSTTLGPDLLKYADALTA